MCVEVCFRLSVIVFVAWRINLKLEKAKPVGVDKIELI